MRKLALNLDFRFDHLLETVGCVERLYWCGFGRDDDAAEVHTQWVRHQTSPFGSLSTPR